MNCVFPQPTYILFPQQKYIFLTMLFKNFLCSIKNGLGVWGLLMAAQSGEIDSLCLGNGERAPVPRADPEKGEDIS